MDLKPTLYGLDLEEAQTLAKDEGVPAYRGRQILDWLYKKHIASIDEAENLPADFRKNLCKKYDLAALSFDTGQNASDVETTKFLFRTRDGHFLESVLIVQKDRKTVCVSTQLGCKVGCPFCASGRGKFIRNLTAGEIIEQVAWIEKRIGTRVTNVVFMGMGEPLDNFEATMKALKILQEHWGFGIGARHITVSTSGVIPKIAEFVTRSEGRVRLSVSLHSSHDETRNKLVPINKRYPISALMETLKKIRHDLKREITFEYTLIPGVNDSDEEAEGLTRLAKAISTKINLIPCNPIRETDFKTPSQEKIQHFRMILHNQGVRVIVRQTAGREIDAACGQLRLERLK